MAGGIYPQDPLAAPLSQEPRDLYVPPSKPGMAQSVGVAVADIPAGITGGDGIKVAVDGRNYRVTMDIAPLQVAAGMPNQQWIPIWLEGTPVDAVRRVPVNAIPADAAHDGIVYGRQNGGWVPAIESVTIDWIDITNKPDYYPPQLPIPSSGVTGLDAKQSEQDGRLTTNEGNIAANAAAITAIDNDLSAVETGKVAKAGDTMSGPLTLPGAPVNALHAATKAYADGKVAKNGDTMTGSLKIEMGSPFITLQPAAAGQSRLIVSGEGTSKRWLIALGDGNTETGANAGSDFRIERMADNGDGIDYPFAINRATGVASFTKTPLVAGSPLIGGATISDTPPAAPIPGQFWWESDTGGLFLRYQDADSAQWVQVNAKGLADAVSDGKTYARKDGAWFDLAATFAGYLPLTGGNITGSLNVSGNLTGGAVFSGAGGSVNAGTQGIVTGGQIAFTTPANYVVGYAGAANVTCGQSLWQIMYGGSATYQFTTGATGSSGFLPLQDNVRYMGAGSFRWTALYAVSGSINTSDEKEKQDIRALDAAELRVARALKPLICAYRWKDAVEQKGDDARIHVGIIAQRVQEAFEAEGLDAHRYGMFCADEIEEYVHAVVEEDENGVAQTVEEGHMRKTGEIRYGVRYDELAMFILAGI